MQKIKLFIAKLAIVFLMIQLFSYRHMVYANQKEQKLTYSGKIYNAHGTQKLAANVKNKVPTENPIPETAAVAVKKKPSQLVNVDKDILGERLRSSISSNDV